MSKIGKTSGEVIWQIILWSGFVLSLPVWALSKLFCWPTMKKKDIFDRWTFAHVFVSYVIADILSFWFSVKLSVILSFSIMYLYELFIDGTRLEDPEGFSISDIGADFIGILFYLLIHLKGG